MTRARVDYLDALKRNVEVISSGAVLAHTGRNRPFMAVPPFRLALAPVCILVLQHLVPV